MRKQALFVFLIAAIVSGCSPQATEKFSEFPLYKGTTWIYAYEAYEPTASDPDQIIKATYQLTETIVEVEIISTYLVAHVRREYELINADNSWIGELSSQPNEFWYVVNKNQVFQSNQSLNADVRLGELIFDYEFPLTVNKSWCLLPHGSKDSKEITSCEAVGRRIVTNQVSYETPAVSFDNCYDLIDYFNGGNVFQKFCKGVGIVYMQFDHAGTKFGFEQTLIDYSTGTP